MTDNLEEIQEIDVQTPETQNIESEIKSLEPQPEETITISKAKLEHLIKKSKAKGIEKGKRETLAMQQQDNQDFTENNQVIRGKSYTESEIRDLIAQTVPDVIGQHVSSMQYEQQAAKEQQMIESFIAKVKPLADQNPEIAQTLMHDINYDDPAMKSLIATATALDNTASIMKEFIEHPEKLATMQALFREQPRLAEKKMNSLSSSIKQNESQVSHNSKEPLSQIKSSNSGINDNLQSVEDYAKRFIR